MIVIHSREREREEEREIASESKSCEALRSSQGLGLEQASVLAHQSKFERFQESIDKSNCLVNTRGGAEFF